MGNKSKILVVKHPSGIKRTIEFNKSASLADVFTTASKQFNLNQNTHELKLGPKTLNLNETIEGSRIPETVVLDIAPKNTSRNSDVHSDVLIQMGFSDEGYLYENCCKKMNSSCSLWDVVKNMVPIHMAYRDEDVCLTHLGIKYKGKERLKTVKLVDLCGLERQLFFTCSRNYLLKCYEGSTVKVKSKAGKVKLTDPPQSESPFEDQLTAEPTMGNHNPGVVELNDRLGRLYNIKYVSSLTTPDELGNPGLGTVRKGLEDGKMLVRIVFSNTAVMEGVFSHDETIKDVADFVKNHLVEKAKQFYFYTVLPRLIISPSKKLGSMKSSPPGTLWYCGKFRSELFKKEILMSLEGRIFSYMSSEVPEENLICVRVLTSEFNSHEFVQVPIGPYTVGGEMWTHNKMRLKDSMRTERGGKGLGKSQENLGENSNSRKWVIIDRYGTRVNF